MIIIAIIFIFLVIAFLKKGIPTLHSNWNALISDFQYSTKEFYERLTVELKSHGIDKVRIVNKNISTGGSFSKQRLYLRVSWKQYTYDCCLAPFGTKNTFVSWWLYSEKTGFESLLSKVPFVGAYLSKAFFPETYYTHDTASMFMTYAQASIQKVIDDITTEKGLRPLSENQKKPILQDVFKR